jgi:hypothetical protein
MRAAAIIGQFVKDQPANNMKTTADALLGTHLQSAAVPERCPMESEETPMAVDHNESRKACGCSSP